MPYENVYKRQAEYRLADGRRMQGDEIGRLDHFVERRLTVAFDRRFRAPREDHVHAEGDGLLSEISGNPTEPDQAECLAEQLSSLIFFLQPFTLPHRDVGGVQVMAERQHMGESDFSDCVGTRLRRISHTDVVFERRLDVDIVDAYTGPHDQLQVSFGAGRDPVSYTHLDVYKRQGYGTCKGK